MSSVPSSTPKPVMSVSGFNAEKLAADSGTTVKAMQKNALTKQYNAVISLDITESDGNKKFFNGSVDYTGLPYPMAVALEQEMVTLLQKLVDLGKTIASGGEAPPPA